MRRKLLTVGPPIDTKFSCIAFGRKLLWQPQKSMTTAIKLIRIPDNGMAKENVLCTIYFYTP